MAEANPHAELHELADTEQHEHPPVVIDDDDWHTALDTLNKTLTKRINDLRTDTDTFKKTVSASVQKMQGDLGTAQTHIQNNADAIQAQDLLIEEAKKKADAAKAAADQATTAAHDAATAAAAAAEKAAEVEANLTSLTTEMRAFEAEYQLHSHDGSVSFDFQTGGPKAGNG
jgi:chromosome segregation ATPase